MGQVRRQGCRSRLTRLSAGDVSLSHGRASLRRARRLGQGLSARRAARARATSAPALRDRPPARGAVRRRPARRARLLRRGRASRARPQVPLSGRAVSFQWHAVASVAPPAADRRAYRRNFARRTRGGSPSAGRALCRRSDLIMPAMPLDGVRVLDFTWVVAGPVATRILADHGAEVVKVERKEPPQLGNRKLGLQCDLNRGKLSVALNMQHPRGVELARRLAAKSDVVIDNFSARVMRSWGMDYESLAAVKPDIICISMSGLGHTGPRSSYVSYGPTLQALTGFTMLMAEPDGTPAGYGYSYADTCGGYTGALAALIAIWNRRRTGRGQFVDLSQFEAVASVIGAPPPLHPPPTPPPTTPAAPPHDDA